MSQKIWRTEKIREFLLEQFRELKKHMGILYRIAHDTNGFYALLFMWKMRQYRSGLTAPNLREVAKACELQDYLFEWVGAGQFALNNKKLRVLVDDFQLLPARSVFYVNSHDSELSFFNNSDEKYAYRLSKKPVEAPLMSAVQNLEQALGGAFQYEDMENPHFVALNNPLIKKPLRLTDLGVCFAKIVILIKEGWLKEGGMLFVDEPEAHLSPKYQHIMMTFLYELSSAGVRVVMTTNSLDMLLRLQMSKKEWNKEISVVRMNEQGCTLPSTDWLRDIINAKADLALPYMECLAERLPK